MRSRKALVLLLTVPQKIILRVVACEVASQRSDSDSVGFCTLCVQARMRATHVCTLVRLPATTLAQTRRGAPQVYVGANPIYTRTRFAHCAQKQNFGQRMTGTKPQRKPKNMCAVAMGEGHQASSYAVASPTSHFHAPKTMGAVACEVAMPWMYSVRSGQRLVQLPAPRSLWQACQGCPTLAVQVYV